MINASGLVKIARCLAPTGGVYVEAGANDGLRQSNTLLIEQLLGWTGLLIEPSPKAFQALQNNRPQNFLIEAALVGAANSGTPREGAFRDGLLTGTMEPSLFHRSPDLLKGRTKHWQRRLRGALGIPTPPTLVTVQTMSLSEAIDVAGFSTIDLLSLDVEGLELEVLNGLEFERHSPRAIVLEVRRDDAWALLQILTLHNYVLVENLSRFAQSSAETWTKDHEDFLFVHQKELAQTPKLMEIVMSSRQV